MKRIIFTLLSLLAFTGLSAQAYQELWAVGTAVPGGAQKLEKVADGDFKFVGKLTAGELRIQTQRKAGADTRYLNPLLPDANIVNHGLAYNESSEAGNARGRLEM